MIARDSVRWVPSGSSSTGSLPREVLGCVLFSLAKAHDHLLQADARASSALFGEVEAHARGMRRDREDVEPHHCLDRAWIRQAEPYGSDRLQGEDITYPVSSGDDLRPLALPWEPQG